MVLLQKYYEVLALSMLAAEEAQAYNFTNLPVI